MPGLDDAIKAPSHRLGESPRLPKRQRRKVGGKMAGQTGVAGAPGAVKGPLPMGGRPAACGIDEAGRGPVLGPLVVAGVAGDEPGLFKELGCTDSKLLSPARRGALHRALQAETGVRIEVRIIEAATLDQERRAGRTLNGIELERFGDIARTLDASCVYVDAADVDARRFGRGVAAVLGQGTRVVSEHKADVTYPIVGAASIVAKLVRDEEIARLGRRLERRVGMPIGSGYCHDPATKAFLAEWVQRFGELPEGSRTTWAPAVQLMAPKAVQLDAFLDA